MSALICSMWYTVFWHTSHVFSSFFFVGSARDDDDDTAAGAGFDGATATKPPFFFEASSAAFLSSSALFGTTKLRWPVGSAVVALKREAGEAVEVVEVVEEDEGCAVGGCAVEELDLPNKLPPLEVVVLLEGADGAGATAENPDLTGPDEEEEDEEDVDALGATALNPPVFDGAGATALNPPAFAG